MKTMFLVTGRTGHSLVISKALPFVELDIVNSIYIFSESEGFEIPKCRYITIPSWIRKCKPAFLSKIIRLFFEPFQLLYYAFKLKPDFINGIYCLPKGLNSYIVSRISGIKCVNSIIGSRLEVETELPFRKMWEKINLWQLRGCDAITIKGQTDKDYLYSNGIETGKMFLLNGAIDIDKFNFASGNRPVDVLFVGSFYELKGPDRILKIIQKLLSSFSNLKAVMVGDGPIWKETKEMAVDLGIDQNVVFEGYKKNTVSYFQQSKILVMPSRSDSLPTSMLEAMACGCVPVISDVGNVKEAALHNVNAKIINNYNDIDSFVENIAELLLDETKRNNYALNARLMVSNKYSIKAQSIIANNIINFLGES